MPEQDLTCAGSANWATFNVHVNAWNNEWLFVQTKLFVHELEQLADYSDAVRWYDTLIAGHIDKFGHKDGVRESQIDFEELADDLRAEQDIEYLLDMEYTTLEEVEEAGLDYEK